MDLAPKMCFAIIFFELLGREYTFKRKYVSTFVFTEELRSNMFCIPFMYIKPTKSTCTTINEPLLAI